MRAQTSSRGGVVGPHLCVALAIMVVLSLPVVTTAQTNGDMAVAGRQVFEQKGCSRCHAVFGQGGDIGPDLGERKFYGSYLDLAGLMWNHFPKMYAVMQKEHLPPAELSSEEMSQLVAYLLSMRYLGEEGNEFRGRRLLRSKRCLSCHKLGGVGGDLGPDFSSRDEYMSPLSLAETMWDHGPSMMQTTEEKKVKWPKISGREIVDMAAAIRASMSPTLVPSGAFRFGDPERGRHLLKEKNCLSCHAIHGQGGNTAPDFGSVEFEYTVTELAGRMWNHGPKMWEAMQQSGVQPPQFHGGELADVLAALYTVRLNDVRGDQKRGRKVLEKKACLSCHSLRGEGEHSAPDLIGIAALESPLEMVTAMWNHAPKMEEMKTQKHLSWPKFGRTDMADLYAYLKGQQLTAETPTPGKD